MDWIFVVLAWSLLAVGLSLLVWSMMWDRSRGRRRCPKCWYGMEGVPASEGGGWTCPECGQTVAKERQLLRTRRRWGIAALALLVFAASYASRSGPAVRDRGWWAAAPDLLLIALLPRTDAFNRPGSSGGVVNTLRDEIGFRSRATLQGPRGTHTNPTWVDGRLWPWERWFLHHQATKMLANAENESEIEQAVWFGVLSSDRLDAGLPSEHLVAVIVARSLLAYERCEQYMDYGIHVNLPGVGPHPYELFVTGMKEPGLFRYEQRDRHPLAHSDWMRTVAWRSHDGVVQRWWTVTEDRGIERRGQIGRALASVHHDVIGALFPAEQSSSPLTLSEVSEYVGEATLLGHRTLQLRGQNLYGGTDTLWIDAETFLVRRAKNFFGDTWFVPHFDDSAAAVLGESWWSFYPAQQDDTPLERFDNELRELLGRIDMPTEEEQLEAREIMMKLHWQRRGTP